MVRDFSFLVQKDLGLKLSQEVTLWRVCDEQHSLVGEALCVLVCCHIVLEVL
jgi:hypothetical protein